MFFNKNDVSRKIIYTFLFYETMLSLKLFYYVTKLKRLFFSS